MHLKTITLRGFKSFAGTTVMHLEPGITCVVGPNGSGKSNVVDALTWVMGEQGVKNLRGGQMTDVIFAGTAAKPAQNRAEVSLVIDNSDGVLPIEYSEVEISRTLFKNGGSEYAINGSPCRLLDIQELLSDTGMGRSMHVIVGQGQIDTVLQAGDQERRAFIEEAAGVLKHRRRKEKALRKLETVQNNLLRVSDLATEIRRQLGPLAKQAQVARRAGVVQAELRDAKLRLLADDLVAAQTEISLDEQGSKEVLVRKEEVQAEVAKARTMVNSLEQKSIQTSPEITKASDTWYALVAVRESLRSILEVASERGRLLGQKFEMSAQGEDPHTIDARAKAVRSQEAELKLEIEQALAHLEQVKQNRSEAEIAEREAEQNLAILHQEQADRREGIARLTEKISAYTQRLQANQTELEHIRQVMLQANKRYEQANSQYIVIESQLALGTADEEQTVAIANLEAEYAHVQEQAERAQQEFASLGAQKAALEAKIDTLSLALKTDTVLEDILQAELPGVLSPLTKVIQVEAGWEDALTTIISEYTDSLVVSDLAAALAVIKYAEQIHYTELNMVFAQMQDNTYSVFSPQVLSARSQIATQFNARFLDELVHSEYPAVQQWISNLCGRYVAVVDRQTAQAVVKAGGSAVTAQGEIFTPINVQSVKGEGKSVLHLHKALESAKAEYIQICEQYTQGQEQLLQAKAAITDAQQTLNMEKQLANAQTAKINALAQELKMLEHTMQTAKSENERSQLAVQRIETDSAAVIAELEIMRKRLQSASADPETAEFRLQAAQVERDKCLAVAKQARASETDARLQVRTVEERVNNLAGRAISLEKAAYAERKAREVAAQKARKRAKQAAVAQIVEDGARLALSKIEHSVSAAAKERDRITALRDIRDNELLQARGLLDDYLSEISRLTNLVHQHEMARAEKRLKVENLSKHAVEEMGINPQEIVQEYGPTQPVILFAPETVTKSEIAVTESERTDNQNAMENRSSMQTVPYVREEQEKRLARAQRDLLRIGKVNPIALEEHAALEERHQFITTQLNDIKKSQADLQKLVKEIDKRVQIVFAQAFADTADKFKEIFPRLFPGGEGELILTDPQDMLNTGIEVQARPAGKKVKRLSLLSGGERSLTALALLVSIFMARPSPFYVMDEVEAALDDANLSRLLQVFKDLQTDSQLIVITHQKRTMEIADALYGVTMASDGVSRVVSQRLAKG